MIQFPKKTSQKPEYNSEGKIKNPKITPNPQKTPNVNTPKNKNHTTK